MCADLRQSRTFQANSEQKGRTCRGKVIFDPRFRRPQTTFRNSVGSNRLKKPKRSRRKLDWVTLAAWEGLQVRNGFVVNFEFIDLLNLFLKSRHGRSGPGPTIVNFYMSQHVPPWVVSSSFVLLDRAASSFLSFLSAPLFFSCKMHLKWWCMVLFFAFCFLCSTFFFIVSGKGRTRLMWLGKVISGPRFEHLTNWGLRFRGHETPFSMLLLDITCSLSYSSLFSYTENYTYINTRTSPITSRIPRLLLLLEHPFLYTRYSLHTCSSYSILLYCSLHAHHTMFLY